jgi:phosphoglycerate dehydrogenase-like enzyme
MKIVVADPSLAPHRSLLEDTIPAGVEVRWVSGSDEEELTRAIADAQVYVGSWLPAHIGAAATALRLVQAAGAGVDGIDPSGLRESVQCANTFRHEQSIAEYVAASLVVLRRRMLAQDAALRAGVWSSPVYDRDIPQPSTLRDAVVTFLGFGHIGQSAWALLRAFGARGRCITRTGSVEPRRHGLDAAGDLSALDEALSASDVLVVSIPLTRQTRELIGTRELDLLGPNGLLVNVARGPIVAEHDLYHALIDHRIAGAALDVWYRYPSGSNRALPSTLPFASLSNVLMTPHSSGVTADTFRERIADIAENITRLFQNQPLRRVVRLP